MLLLSACCCCRCYSFVVAGVLSLSLLLPLFGDVFVVVVVAAAVVVCFGLVKIVWLLLTVIARKRLGVHGLFSAFFYF